MPQGTGQDLVDSSLREYATLKTQRAPWEPGWQAIADTMLPVANDIISVRTPGTTRTQRLYDGTAMHSAQLLTGHINAGVTNFATRWFGLRMGDPMIMWDREVQAWLDSCATIMNDWLVGSMAPQAVHEMYLSYVIFGTGGLYVDEQPLVQPRPGFRGLMARSQPIASYCLAENAVGQVDTVYREFELSPRQAEQWFGYDALHATVQASLERAEARHVPSPYLHVVYPRRKAGRTAGRKTCPMPRAIWTSVRSAWCRRVAIAGFPMCFRAGPSSKPGAPGGLARGIWPSRIR